MSKIVLSGHELLTFQLQVKQFNDMTVPLHTSNLCFSIQETKGYIGFNLSVWTDIQKETRREKVDRKAREVVEWYTTEMADPVHSTTEAARSEVPGNGRERTTEEKNTGKTVAYTH